MHAGAGHLHHPPISPATPSSNKMQTREFSPVILFHDYSYPASPSSTERMHIPCGDPYYSPLIEQKRSKINEMLEINGRLWNNVMRNNRESSPNSNQHHPSFGNNKNQTMNQHHHQHDHLTSLPPLLSPSLSTQQQRPQSMRSPPIFFSSSEVQAEDSSSSISGSSSGEEDSHHYSGERYNMTTITPPYYCDFTRQKPSRELSQFDTGKSIFDGVVRRRRGNLPKPVTAILKQWLMEHCSNPYPTEDEKNWLQRRTGLTLNQISNWFINARRRILPMILLKAAAAEGRPLERYRKRRGKPPSAASLIQPYHVNAKSKPQEMLVIKKRGTKRSAYANDLDDPHQAKYNKGV
ncbi:hypothetical protein O0I10_001999 [Lichtheimia ornata]|uniref:Homeobox domain-containing protein n=1 Tax=Lichtheimia ornata TaxID=688661 RepID=A0AAD7VD73_9FUNG|nr:uncharacterized protein O0I10_001999 [Lichtheimia ornata]KAJ8662306.1 hypothetical protein O0I10_001999 [Lichtheimia ornata]